LHARGVAALPKCVVTKIIRKRYFTNTRSGGLPFAEWAIPFPVGRARSIPKAIGGEVITPRVRRRADATRGCAGHRGRDFSSPIRVIPVAEDKSRRVKTMSPGMDRPGFAACGY
jgi:hypothetical protein